MLTAFHEGASTGTPEEQRQRVAVIFQSPVPPADSFFTALAEVDTERIVIRVLPAGVSGAWDTRGITRCAGSPLGLPWLQAQPPPRGLPSLSVGCMRPGIQGPHSALPAFRPQATSMCDGVFCNRNTEPFIAPAHEYPLVLGSLGADGQDMHLPVVGALSYLL